MVAIARYRLYFLATLLITLLACNFSPTSSLQTNRELARSADSFIDSLGIVIKLHYTDTAYSRYDDLIKPRLQELGIRHVREEGRPKHPHIQAKLNDLATIGIKSTLIMDPRWKVTPENAVTLAKNLAGSIEAVEGPNEWDIHPRLKYQGQSYPQGVRDFQRELYQAIKTDPKTSYLPVLSSSVAKLEQISQLGRLDCDIANIHSYPRGGKSPTHRMDKKWIPAAKISCDSEAIMATESGYHNAINKYGISEQASAKYLPRLFLEYFNRGIKRTYIHQLLNLKSNPEADNPTVNYGLLRYDGSEKPAFVALKNLINILKDPRNSNTETLPLKYLDYKIIGNTENINHTLLQKQDGKFYLILWQDVLSYNVPKKKDVIVPSQSIRLMLKTKIRKAETYQPLYSSKSFQEFRNTPKIALQVADHPLIVKLSP
ncbi:MAG: hypothetical protein QNJ34_10665 [Xenococcaceae cyanobacterium MO_188.B29]|nr:hypothetical protein [Xenococcaceae cyanobacterium MO_188.B29]